MVCRIGQRTTCKFYMPLWLSILPHGSSLYDAICYYCDGVWKIDCNGSSRADMNAMNGRYKRAGGLCIKNGILVVRAGEIASDSLGVLGVRHVGSSSFSSVISHTLSV